MWLSRSVARVTALAERSCPMQGGGEVHVHLPCTAKLPPVSLTEEGMPSLLRLQLL